MLKKNEKMERTVKKIVEWLNFEKEYAIIRLYIHTQIYTFGVPEKCGLFGDTKFKKTVLQKFGKERNRYDTGREKDGRNPKNIMHQACDQYAACCFDDSGECSDKFTDGFRMGRPRIWRLRWLGASRLGTNTGCYDECSCGIYRYFLSWNIGTGIR